MENTERNIALPLDEDVRDLLGQVHVNMPWKNLPMYLETILHWRLNVEIGFEAEELDLVSPLDLRRTAEQLQNAGCRITLHAPFWDLCPGSVDPFIRHVSHGRLRRLFDLPAVFHPLKVVCHTGYDPRHHHSHRQAWLERSMALWEPLVERAELLKCSLLLENVWESDPGFHHELFERLSSPYFGFCLDVGHQHSFSGAPLAVWLEALSGFLQEVHLHDNDGTGDAHLPIGQGTIDFGLLFRYLRTTENAPVLTLEPHRKEHFVESLRGLKHVLRRIEIAS